MQAYISDTSAFLPNAPVENDQLESVLGEVYGASSRARRLILRNNGIRQRHYAINPATGAPTHNNAQLAAEAARLLQRPTDIACLCCGTSTPDQILPGHASMVHGELDHGPLEVVSTAGVCVSGMSALKYAAMAVATGAAPNAVATGSELVSSFLRARLHENAAPLAPPDELEKEPSLAFDTDFLRWMLSDGAGAVYIEPKQPTDRPSFEIEWIDIVSYAHEREACMYAGAMKEPNGRLKGWREFDSIAEAAAAGCFAIKQDVRLLNRDVIDYTVDRALERIARARNLRPDQVDWFLPHYSSEYFRQPVAQGMRNIGFDLAPEKWFTNLATKGNTGAASMFIMLDEFRRSNRMEPGRRLLCYIPESGRFSVCWMLLKIV